MQTIMSETLLLEQYRSFPKELQIAVSSYFEVLSQNYNLYVNQALENKNIRKFGILKNGIKYMATDFDEPLEDFKDYM
jgi:hypothetical protein